MKKKRGPKYYKSIVNNDVLNYDEYYMSFRERLIYTTVIVGLGGLAGELFYGGWFKNNGTPTLLTHISNIVVFCVFGLLALKIFYKRIVEKKRLKRQETLRGQFRDLLSSMSTSLSSGANIYDSIRNSYDDLQGQYSENSYIVSEIYEILEGINNNVTVEKMFEEFGTRSGVDDIKNFAIVFATCNRRGGDIKKAVRRTYEIISEKIVIEEEIKTKVTSNKLQLNMMIVIPFVIVLMLKNSSSSFAESFASVVGVIGLTISAAIYLAAYLLGQKILKM